MNYSPRGHYVWDAWCMPVDGVVHAYHLQRTRPGFPTDDKQDCLGHAVSTNLVDWEEREPAFGPDPANPQDDCQPWTGCALWHEGQGYLYYTMRGSQDECRVQRIGLATTKDGNRWQRHADNPVIVPDPRWYATTERPVPGVVDCRDLIVVQSPERNGWYGFYATRRPGEELPETSVIACVFSGDLIHWEHRPPAFAPSKYACIEVPDVFELNGRWYMTCLTGNHYGNRGIFSDPNAANGTVYAVSDRPEGPYAEPDDNVLLAARTTAPISMRSLMFEGERYVLYTDRERRGHTDAGDMTLGTLTTPKVLRTDGDRLYVAYSPRIESRVIEELIGPGRPPRLSSSERIWGQIWQMRTARWQVRDDAMTGESRTGWGVGRFDPAPESFIYEAAITIEWGAAAGLALRMDEEMTGAVVTLEADEQVVAFHALPGFDFSEKRRTPIPRTKPVHLRIVNRLEHIEVYVNDDLRLAFSRYRGIGGNVGIFVDSGKARFQNIRLRALDVTRPDGAAVQ